MEDIEESIENKTIERDTTEVKPDGEPAVKIKKPRSEAQKKAFEKARAARAVNFKKRQEERAKKDTQIKEVPAPVAELKPVLQRRPPSPRYREQQPTTVTHNYYYNESPKPKKIKKKIQVQSSDDESDEEEIQVVYQQESVVHEPSPTPPPTRPTNPLKFKYT